MTPDTLQLFLSVTAISILHAILPNHWLAVVAIARQLRWTSGKTVLISMGAALAHSLSTVVIGVLISRGSSHLGNFVPSFSYITSGILILLGIIFIWRHQHHKHFHMRDIDVSRNTSMTYVVGSLWLAMFLSPCLEVSALFFAAGSYSFGITFLMGAIYTLTSAIGITLFAWLALRGLQRWDWHRLEHNTGLISGSLLILTGILFLILH